MPKTHNQPELARHIGLFSLIVYGVGDMVGAGIYGTIGVAAGVLGNAVWLAFIGSMIVAMLTGLSYASLSSRYPRAGGASFITQRAYGIPYLSYLVGLSVTASGLVSMAAGTNVFTQTLTGIFPFLSQNLMTIVFLGFLCCINLIGIKESLKMNLVCTTVEVLGLLFIVCIGASYWGSVNYLEMPSGTAFSIPLLLSGSVLTFYAFIGFEDMLNVAEEVKDPETVIPKGLVTALLITGFFYVLISITAVSVVPSYQLADLSLGAPMAQITKVAAPWVPAWFYNAITMFAVANTVLLNYVMSSRMLYGMSRDSLIPSTLKSIHHRFRTPHYAIYLVGALVLGLAFIGSIAQLASATSLLLLSCFCIVNVALIVLKRNPKESVGKFEIPAIIPMLGCVSCGALIISKLTAGESDWTAPMIAGGIVVCISVLYLFFRGQKKL